LSRSTQSRHSPRSYRRPSKRPTQTPERTLRETSTPAPPRASLCSSAPPPSRTPPRLGVGVNDLHVDGGLMQASGREFVRESVADVPCVLERRRDRLRIPLYHVGGLERRQRSKRVHGVAAGVLEIPDRDAVRILRVIVHDNPRHRSPIDNAQVSWM